MESIVLNCSNTLPRCSGLNVFTYKVSLMSSNHLVGLWGQLGVIAYWSGQRVGS